MNLERKSIEILADDDGPDGAVTAVIATLGVKDKDGDVTRPGFFPAQPYPIKMVQAHEWGTIMLGKGTIQEVGGQAVFKGQLNLDEDDSDARALYSRLKFDMNNPPPLIQWSYGFRLKDDGFTPTEYGRDLHASKDGGPGADFYEVSPVLVGAGEGTGTLAVKSGNGRFVDEIDAVTSEVNRIIARGTDITVLRSQNKDAEGNPSPQTLGVEALAKLRELHDALDGGRKAVADLIIRNTNEIEQAIVEAQHALYVTSLR